MRLPVMRRLRTFRFAASLALAACASRPEAAPPAATAHDAKRSAPPPPAASPPPPERDLRRLSAGSNFADWVEAAGLLDIAGAGRSEAGCLLRNGEPLRLEADLLLAAHPLPRPEPGLGSMLQEQVGAPAVITAWGTVPSKSAGLVLLAFTTTTPGSARLPAVGLFATRAGTFVRADDVALRAQRDPLPATGATALLSELSGPAVVYVTADPDVPSSELLQLLRAVPNRLELALAVALPKNTRLPPPAADTRDALCPDGLPEPGKDDAEGELSASAAQSAFAPLREAALSCALTTGGRALLGGRLVLGVRIGADGKARDACFVSDAIGEPMLRRCLVSATRDMSLPVPSPTGFVDLHIPLEITLAGPQAQRASCE
jgi:hypothetical protein